MREELQRLRYLEEKTKRFGYVIAKIIWSYRPQLFALPQGYFASPTQQQIFAHGGNCPFLVISNHFGSVRWLFPLKLHSMGLPFAQNIIITDQTLEVYPSTHSKPQPGNELNQPCLATFHSRKQLNLPFLLKMCKNNGTQLMSFDRKGKCYTVKIPHFTRYSFVELKQSEKPGRFSEKIHGLVDRIRGSNFHLRSHSVTPMMANNFDAQQNREVINGRFQLQKKVNKNQHEQGSSGDQKRFFPMQISQAALYIQNSQRRQLGYNKYRPSAHNILAKSNFMPSCDGGLIKVANYHNSQAIHIKNSTKVQSQYKKFFGFQELLLQFKPITSQKIGSVVKDLQYSQESRRFLSIYAILFQNELCFKFIRDATFIYRLIQTPLYTVDQNDRDQLIKDWLAWTVYAQYENKKSYVEDYLPYKSLLMKALALRQPAIALKKLLQDENWDDLEIFMRLQDRKYRKAIKHTVFSKQIMLILVQSIKKLECKEWLLSLAMSSWYFLKDTLINNLEKILNYYQNNPNNKYWLQFRLFQLYLISKGHKLVGPLYQHPRPAFEELCCQWFGTNTLGLSQFEIKAFDKEEKKLSYFFSQYCFNLTKTISQSFIINNRLEDARNIIEKSLILSIQESEQLKISCVVLC